MSDLIERLRKGHGYDSQGIRFPTKLDNDAADALEQAQARVDGLENMQVWLYNQGYQSGHHDTVEGMFTDVLPVDMETYHADLVADLIADEALDRGNPK